MKDYYIQNIIDYFWKEDNVDEARFSCFEFLIYDYRREKLNFEEFDLLFNIVLLISKFYKVESYVDEEK